jgi:hypothetical protein
MIADNWSVTDQLFENGWLGCTETDQKPEMGRNL